MNIPLDQLYNYLDSIVNGYVIIYRWKVHGYRNLGDCTMLREQSDPYYSSMTKPHMIFHDQEPLNFDYYENSDYIDYVKNYSKVRLTYYTLTKWEGIQRTYKKDIDGSRIISTEDFLNLIEKENYGI